MNQNFIKSTISKLVLFAMVFMFVQTSMAAEVLVATMLRSDSSEKSYMYVKTNSVGDAEQFVVKTGAESIRVSPSEIQGKGKVLLKERGQNVLTLKSGNDFSIYAGGGLNLVYLKEYNIIGSNKYGQYSFDLERDGDKWFLSKDGRKFSSMKVNVYTWGISSIEFR